MFKKDSLYAINKKTPDAVVYQFANGEVSRITREDFPSEEAFLAFKAWSDEDFHEEDNNEVNEDRRVVSIDDISDAAIAVPAVDVLMVRQQERNEKRRQEKELVVQLKGKLTETQFRRLWLHEVEGKTLEEIAKQDGVAFQSVHESIEGAKKKILKKL